MQSNKSLRQDVQKYGCTWLSCLAMSQIYLHHALSVTQLNFLSEIAIVNGILGEESYVNDTARAARLPVEAGMLQGEFLLHVIDSVDGPGRSVVNSRGNTTILYVLRMIKGEAIDHFILYYADGTLAYDSLPAYQLVGVESRVYYGFRYDERGVAN